MLVLWPLFNYLVNRQEMEFAILKDVGGNATIVHRPCPRYFLNERRLFLLVGREWTLFPIAVRCLKNTGAQTVVAVFAITSFLSCFLA